VNFFEARPLTASDDRLDEHEEADDRLALSPRQRTRLERDREPGYSINVKQIILAFAVEFVIIGLIIVNNFVTVAQLPDGTNLKTIQFLLFPVAMASAANAEDSAPSRIDNITKSARDMMPAMPAMPSVSLPSMPDLSLPDFSDATGRLMTEFNTFTQQVSDALPMLEQMGYEVTTFKVTWGLPPKAPASIEVERQR
jgi:hypothetical protein